MDLTVYKIFLFNFFLIFLFNCFNIHVLIYFCLMQEKGMTEDEIAGWHHQLDELEFE